jgi:hypothetical protein
MIYSYTSPGSENKQTAICLGVTFDLLAHSWIAIQVKFSSVSGFGNVQK